MGSRSRSPPRLDRSPPRRSRSPRRGPSRSPTRGKIGGGGERMTGIACRWNERGFGFIRPPDGGEDLFCHVSAIMDGNTLREGDTVQFVKVFDEKRGKERAEDITGGVTADGDAPRARFNDQVCFDFMKGRCTRGQACRYSHDSKASGWDPNYGDRVGGGRDRSPPRRAERYDSRDRGYDDRRRERSPPRRRSPPRDDYRDRRDDRRSPPWDDYRGRSPPRDRRDDYDRRGRDDNDRRDRYEDRGRGRSPPRERSPPRGRSPLRDDYRDRRDRR